MRNLKKLLAVVVTIAMIATFAIPAFAAETKTEAQIVTDLGMLKGAGAGVTAEYLATQPDRLQAAILFLRLLGKEAEAKAFTGTDNFSDVAGLSAENTAILAYLKANPDLGYGGIGGDKFDPLTKMTAKAYYKVVLVALGYAYGTDFTWENVMSFAAGKGLTKNIDVETFTVNDLAVGTVEALRATVKGGTETLVAKLIAAGTIASADAVAAGIYAVPVVNPAVVSATADNLIEVVFTFNKAIDGDTIDDGDFQVGGVDVLADNVSLSDDKKVATAKLDMTSDDPTDPMGNGDEVDVDVSGIADVDGTDVADYSATIVPVDNQQPAVTAVEFTGPETAKLTFSEPMKEAETAPEVSIDGGLYTGTPVDGWEADTSVTIDLGTELDEGSHVFKVKGFEDYAGYTNLVQNKTVDYASIETAATATVKEADQSTVTLTFNRPVTGFNSDTVDGTLANFYQTYSNWHPLEIQNADGDVIMDPAVEDGDGYVSSDEYYDEVVLVFTNAAKATPDDADDADADDKPLPVGTDKIVIKDGAVEDRWGNANDGDVVLSAAIAADDTKPEVTKVTVESESEIYVYFSKAVSSDAVDKGNYVIKDSEGTVIKTSKYHITYNSDDDYADIVFYDALDLGKYTITADGIADTTISGNTLDSVTKSFEITDSSATTDDTIATWVNGSNILYVKYPDAMATTGTGSVLDKDNYRIQEVDADGDPVVDIHGAPVFEDLADGVKVTMFTSKIVKMQFPTTGDYIADELAWADYTAEGVSLQIGKVSDAAGNVVGDLSTILTVGEEVGPQVTAIEKTAKNKFELTINQDLKSIAAGAITVDRDGTNDGADMVAGVDQTLEKIASVKFTNDGDSTVIAITVPDYANDPGTQGINEDSTYPDYTISIGEEKIKSITGVWMDPVDLTIASVDPDGEVMGITDGIAPAVDENGDGDSMVYAYDCGGVEGQIDHIIIKYTEGIKLNSLSKYTFDVDGYDVSAVTEIAADDLADVIAQIDGVTDNDNLDAAAGSWIVIAVDEINTDNEEETDIDQAISVAQNLDIEDADGNELTAPQDSIDSFSGEDSTVQGADHGIVVVVE